MENLEIMGADLSGVQRSRSQPTLQRSNLTDLNNIKSSRSDTALLPPCNLRSVGGREGSVGPYGNALNTEVASYKSIKQIEMHHYVLHLLLSF